MSLSIQAKHAGAPGLVPALKGSHISRHRARAVCMTSRPPLPLLSRLPLVVAAAAAHDGAAAAAQASTSRVRRVHLARPPRRSSQTASSSAAEELADSELLRCASVRGSLAPRSHAPRGPVSRRADAAASRRGSQPRAAAVPVSRTCAPAIPGVIHPPTHPQPLLLRQDNGAIPRAASPR